MTLKRCWYAVPPKPPLVLAQRTIPLSRAPSKNGARNDPYRGRLSCQTYSGSS
jgi:hypothetical protein